MSNRTRRLKSKAMQNKWVFDRDGNGNPINYRRIKVNNGTIQNGGSNLLKRKNNSVVNRNQINKNGGNILSMTRSDSCCGTSKVNSNPVKHYSYMNYLNRKVRTCSKQDPDGNRCTNIFQKIPDIGPNGGYEFYLENKKSCVYLNEERDNDGQKREVPDNGKITYPNVCCDPNSKLRILANNHSTPGFVPIKPVVGNGFNLNTTYTKYVGKSNSQIRREKKPTITKTLPFNYASLQTARVKARRNISGSSCNRSTPFERANANIQMCKHI